MQEKSVDLEGVEFIIILVETREIMTPVVDTGKGVQFNLCAWNQRGKSSRNYKFAVFISP